MRIRRKNAPSRTVAGNAATLPELAFRADQAEIPAPPTVVGSIGRHRLLVLAGTLAVAAGAVAYTYQQPKSYSATATVSMVQPTNNQALGTPAAASPQQYVESQMLVLESQPVAAQAATLANRALRTTSFAPSDFSGPGSKLKVTTQTSLDPNSGLVSVTYSASSPIAAATGANSLVRAYAGADESAVNQTYLSMTNAIDNELRSVDGQLQNLSGKPGALDNQLATSLVAQRTDLLQRRSLVAIDQQASLASSPSIVEAYPPRSASNRKLTKVVPVGAIAGFVLAACVAYGIESRRRRAALDRIGNRPAVAPGRPGQDDWAAGWATDGVPTASEVQS